MHYLNRNYPRRVLISAIAAAALTALPAEVGFAQSSPLLGNWKINLSKSRYVPGPPPMSGTSVFEAVGEGIRITTEGIDAEGKPTKVDFGVISFDGKSYPVKGASAYDARSYKQLGPATFEYTSTKGGKVVQKTAITVIDGGKTRSLMTTGIDEKGQQIYNLVYYDKQ